MFRRRAGDPGNRTHFEAGQSCLRGSSQLTAHQQWPGRCYSVHAEGRHGRSRCASGERGRRNNLHGFLMSRFGNKTVAVPTGVTANVEGQTVKVKGPKGALQVVVHDEVSVVLDKGAIKLEPRGESKRARAMWGTSRTLVANVVAGGTQGFEQKHESTG